MSLLMLTVALGVVLSGCNEWEDIAHDWEKKPFIPGGYYEGDETEKVNYSALGGYGAAAEGARMKPYEAPCLDSNTTYKDEQTASEAEENIGWFFKNDSSGKPIGWDQIRYHPDWSSSNTHLFEFDASGELIDVIAPFQTGPVVSGDYWPDEATYDAHKSEPADMFGGLPESDKGYTMTLTSTSSFWKGQLKEEEIAGRMIKVRFDHLSRFWCCAAKPNADVESTLDKSIAIYRPKDSSLQKSYMLSELIGHAGMTGAFHGESDTTDGLKTFVRVTLQYKDVPNNSSASMDTTWKSLTFEQFWNGPTAPQEEAPVDKPEEVTMTVRIPRGGLEKWYTDEAAILPVGNGAAEVRANLGIEVENTNATNDTLVSSAVSETGFGYSATVNGGTHQFKITAGSTFLKFTDGGDPPLDLGGGNTAANSRIAETAFKDVTFTLMEEPSRHFLMYDGAVVTSITFVQTEDVVDYATVDVDGVVYGESLAGVAA